MRLFIALFFEDSVLEMLTGFQEELRKQGVRGNYTLRENLHITLAFIGEYGNPDEILDVMETVPFRPVELKFEGYQHCRDMYFAKIADNPGLESYVRRLRRTLSENDIPFDRKSFKPHITLVRKVSFRNGSLEGIPKIDDQNGFVAQRVSLMRSERGKNGMIYTELGVF